jgi:DNA-binding transcriptional LysR family regulator
MDTHPLAQVSIEDFKILTILAQVRSVRELARRTKLDPGNISRRLKWLESQFGIHLLDRTAAGVQLTESAKSLLPQISQVLDICTDMNPRQTGRLSRMNVGAPSFINSKILTSVINHLNDNGEIAFNLLDIAPDEILSHGASGAIDIALHFGKMKWPKTWTSSQIGSIRWLLVSAPTHPIARRKTVTQDDVVKHPFAYPLYWTDVGMTFGDDFCPAGKSSRQIGIGTATAETALGSVLKSGMLGFLPEPIVAERIRLDQLLEIRVKGWPKVTKDLFVAARSGNVSQIMLRKLKETVAQEIAKL